MQLVFEPFPATAHLWFKYLYRGLSLNRLFSYCEVLFNPDLESVNVKLVLVTRFSLIDLILQCLKMKSSVNEAFFHQKKKNIE